MARLGRSVLLALRRLRPTPTEVTLPDDERGPPERGRDATKEPAPQPVDEVDEWGYESFPASDPPQH